MEFTSPEGEERYAALVARAADVVVGLDFDGTLAPIVDDPEAAHIHPDAPEVLTGLADAVRAVAVITGRPARQALALGGLDEVGNAIGGRRPGAVPVRAVRQRAVVLDQPPGRLAPAAGRAGDVRAGAAAGAATADAGEAFVEDKGLAVAVHTRRLDDPDDAFDRLVKPITELAERHGLSVEPGRQVLEVRSHGMHKGLVVEWLMEHLEAGGFLFAGDDLGDVEAFEAVLDLRRRGLPTLLVCSASREEPTLREMSDVVVDGPAGVLDLLRKLTADAS